MAIDILEIMYVDANGNEVSESQLKEKFGDNWEEKSKQAGYTIKKPDNTETNTEIDMEIETPEFNIESLGGIVDENFWTPDSLPEGTSLVDPNKGFQLGKIYHLKNFDALTNKERAESLERAYGGNNGGFSFTPSQSGITVKAPNDQLMHFSNMDYTAAGSRGGVMKSPKSRTKKDYLGQEQINDFIKANLDVEDFVNRIQPVDNEFEKIIEEEIYNAVATFATDEDFSTDEWGGMPLNTLLNKDPRGFMNSTMQYMQEAVRNKIELGELSPEFRLDDNIPEHIQDQILNRVVHGLAHREVVLNETNIYEKVIKPLQENGNATAFFEAWKNEHITAITDPLKQKLAKQNKLLLEKAAELNNTNGDANDSNYLKNTKDYEQLKLQADSLLKQMLDDDALFLYDPNSLIRYNNQLVATPNNAGQFAVDHNLIDVSDEYNFVKGEIWERMEEAKKTGDWQTITNQYNVHNAEYSDWKDYISTTKFNVRVSSGDLMSLSEGPGSILASLGYKMIPYKEYYKEGHPLHKYGPKITREQVVSHGTGLGAPPIEMAGSFGDIGAGVYKNVKLEDLLKVYGAAPAGTYPDPKGKWHIADADLEIEGVTETSSGAFPEDAPDVYAKIGGTPSLARLVGNSGETQRRLMLERSGWQNLYLLNIDPASIDANDWGSTFENFAAGLMEAMPWQGYDQQEKVLKRQDWFTTDRDMLDQVQFVLDKANQTLDEDEIPFQLSEEQRDALDVDMWEEFVYGMGGFMPIIAEIGILTAATSYMGGIGGAASLNSWLARTGSQTWRAVGAANKGKKWSKTALTLDNLKKLAKTNDATKAMAWAKSKGLTQVSGGTMDQLKRLMVLGAMEEGKMRALDPVFETHMPEGAGFGFVAGGALARRFLPTNVFRKEWAVLNPVLEKGLYGGIGGMMGAESAAAVEAVYDDLVDRKDIQTFIDEHYPDLSTVGRRIFIETAQFGLLGISKMNKADRHFSMQGKRNLLRDIQNKTAEDYKDNPNQLIKDLQLAAELKKQIRVSENREKYYDVDVMAAEVNGKLQKFNRQYKQAEGKDAFSFQVQTNGRGMDGAPALFSKKNGKPHIRINVAKMDAGTLPHEVWHWIMNTEFKSDVGLSRALKNTIKSRLDKIDWDYGKEGKEGSLESAVDAAYKDFQSAKSMSEEFNAAVIALLNDPKYQSEIMTKNIWGQLKQDLIGFAEKNLYGKYPALKGLFPELRNPQDIINLIGRIGTGISQGEYNPRQIQRLKDVRISGIRRKGKSLEDVFRLEDTQTGERLSYTKLQQRQLTERNKEISKANEKAFEDYRKTDNREKLLDDVYKNNKGLVKDFVNTFYKRDISDISRAEFEAGTTMYLLDNIVRAYDGKTPFGAYARMRLFGSEKGDGGRWTAVGNILKSLGANENLFKVDLEQAGQMSTGTPEYGESGKPKTKRRGYDPRRLNFPAEYKAKTSEQEAKEYSKAMGFEVSRGMMDVIKAIKSDLTKSDLTAEGYGKIRIGEKQAEILGEIFGINPELFTNPKRNVQAKDADGFAKLRTMLSGQAQMVINMIPDAYTSKGKSTFIPENVKKLFFEKNADGKWIKRKNITIKEVKDALTPPTDKPIYRSAEAQTIKGIAELVFRGIKNKVARVEGELDGATKTMLQSMADGKNPAMAQRVLSRVNEDTKTDISMRQLQSYLGEYQENKQEFYKKYPEIAEKFNDFIEQVLLDKALVDVQESKEGTTFKKELPSKNKVIKTKFGDIKYNELDIYRTMGLARPVKKGGKKQYTLYDQYRIEKFIEQAEQFASSIPKEFADFIGAKETLLQTFGLHYATTGRGVKEFGESKSKTPKRNLEGKDIGELDFTKSQEKKLYDALGTGKLSPVWKDLLFAELGKIKGEKAEKDAVERSWKYETEAEKIAELKKYINEDANNAKALIYWTVEAAKQQWLYDAKSKGEFVNRANYIYQLASMNSQLIKGVNRQYVPIQAVLYVEGKGAMKLEHVKTSIKQSMEAANAIVQGRWIKDGKKIMEDYTGIISTNQYLARIDKLGGTTNTAGLSRMVLDMQNLKNYRTVESDFKQTLYDKLVADLQQKTGAKIRELSEAYLKNSVAKMALEPSRPNEVVLKADLKNKGETKKSYEADVKLAKKSGTLAQRNISKAEILENLNNRDLALANARKKNKKKKGISVFDFDDTLAKSNSKVLYTLPNGKKGQLSATEFAKRSEALEAEGAIFDFKQFNKVIGGKKGPLADLALKRQGKFGSSNIYVLTARPQQAARAIHRFLKGIGLEIPLENITGLENGSPTAKSNWILKKAAEGYNDFYFADDAIKNVKAVKKVLDVIDVKSKVQQALAQRNLSKSFNDIIQEKTGIRSETTFSDAKGALIGKTVRKGLDQRWITPGAEDFAGLLWLTLPKGKKGDAAKAFYKKSLFDPFNRAEDNITRDQVSLGRDLRGLKKKIGITNKELKATNETGFTNEHAIRVRMWTKMGLEIEGLSKTDLKEINKMVRDNPKLEAFANELLTATKNSGWTEPTKDWMSGSLSLDARNLIRGKKRTKYLEESGWMEAKNEIFSKANLNKLEAAYGKDFRLALEGTLRRMVSGRNRDAKDNLENRVLDYINNSVGAIMFLNTRSALLQTISSVNFVNWTDNNPIKAAKALGNIKQYSRDFLELMNSDYLTARRDGLKLNIAESEIAESGGGRGLIDYMLKKGFVFTRYADSFAIASGGATFYRNRINTYKKQGMSELKAKEKAFLDFKEISEESQQSSRTDRISQQQASNLGRIILAFANTPMQYARLQKKAILDLANGRGDYKTNLSKITYYGFVQNLIFNAVQNAMFGIFFGDDDTDARLMNKSGRVANGMADSTLRGLGVQGATVAMIKNVILKLMEEHDKDRPKYSEAAWKILSVSPTVDSKIRKLRNAAKSAEYGAFDDMTFGVDNEAYMAMANVISATANVPVDRVLRKLQNIDGALYDDVEFWQRVSMMMGYQDWELGIESEYQKKKKSKKSSGKVIIP